jgi:hypothetical protein
MIFGADTIVIPCEMPLRSGPPRPAPKMPRMSASGALSRKRGSSTEEVEASRDPPATLSRD